MVDVLKIVKDNLVLLQDTSLPTITYVVPALNTIFECLQNKQGELPKLLI
jgi:hypothetical protein